MARRENYRKLTRRGGPATPKLIASFKDLIAQGVLVPGCKLLPERELAKRFGVNRATLRQVLKLLEVMGVLSQRVGDGTYLKESAADILAEPMDFLMIMGDISHDERFEARLIVEPELAARAAERATAQDLAALRQAIQRMEKSTTARAKLIADLAFHDALFQASGNRVCQLIFSVIHQAIFKSIVPSAERFPPQRLQRAVAFHKAIYAAISEQKPEVARAKMIEHLTESQALLSSVVKVRTR
jgi:GntR family transcriptional repressor for pyruvate dehydrogenase complex